MRCSSCGKLLFILNGSCSSCGHQNDMIELETQLTAWAKAIDSPEPAQKASKASKATKKAAAKEDTLDEVPEGDAPPDDFE